MTNDDATRPTAVAEDPASELRARYLDLVERGLTHSLYAASDIRLMPHGRGLRHAFIGAVVRRLAARGIAAVRLLPRDAAERTEGRDWPVFAQTMIGTGRLSHLRRCVEDVITRRVPGDFIEAGVWRGGAAIMMRAVLVAYGIRDRRVWLADSFSGLPPPRAEHEPDSGANWHTFAELEVSQKEVEENFRLYGLLDDQVQFVPGWFSESLASVAQRSWALIRIDADMYGSTSEALEALYPRLSPGGYIIIDDYGGVEACKHAVEDFRAKHDITEPIQPVDWTAVCWRRDSSR